MRSWLSLSAESSNSQNVTSPSLQQGSEAKSGDKKGKKGDGKNRNDDIKRRRYDNSDRLTNVVTGLRTSLDLGIENSNRIRMLSGVAFATALVPESDALKSASQVQDQEHPEKAHARRWAILILHYSENNKVSEKTRVVLRDHASSVTSE
jgi:hypothetical protein